MGSHVGMQSHIGTGRTRRGNGVGIERSNEGEGVARPDVVAHWDSEEGQRLVEQEECRSHGRDPGCFSCPHVRAIGWAAGRRLQEVLDGFERKGFPGCVGAIDGTHIYVKKPSGERAECYYDRTGQFSVQAQVVCDNECHISSVYVGCPGSLHDSRALRLSPLYAMAREGRGLFGTGSVVLRDERTVGRYLLGDAGYPLLPWIMIPGWRGTRTEQQRMYNDCHTSARSCIEGTFGRLKAVWRHFIRQQICNMKTLCKDFMAICILHNIMVDHRVVIDPDDLSDDSDDDLSDDNDDDLSDADSRPRRRRRVAVSDEVPQAPDQENDPTYGSDLGKDIRNSLVTHVCHHARVHGAPQPSPWGS
ncbi:hypothetical protein CBR_g38817 [Chara braunii]|uniref:DDE Tnp4 domain-containing protein n=1 Tax=Chara braunii TaxID=69332 RepID=A0A388LQL2_CHABU|nr:hypothetical protein CBR_g38817 [Chara braunii]|eukprot:GBG84535.1 hypothetical protein CBR_g38817 [Chara braunii]